MSVLSIAVANPPSSQTDVFHSYETITSNVSNLEFSTVMPGGYGSCSFELSVSYAESIVWYTTRLGFWIRIYGHGEIAWEGRINAIELLSYGVRIQTLGFWSSLLDRELMGFWNENRTSEWKEYIESTWIYPTSTTPRTDRWSVRNEGVLLIQPIKGEKYQTGVIGGYIYVIPDPESGVGDTDFAYQPHDIERLYISNLAIANGGGLSLRLKVYAATDPKTGWTAIASLTTGSNWTIDLTPAGSRVHAVALMGDVTQGSLTEYTGETGETAYIKATGVELYASISGHSTDKVTIETVAKGYLSGAGNHLAAGATPAALLSDDDFWIDSSTFEIMPCRIDTPTTLQDLLVKLGEMGDGGSPPQVYIPAIWSKRRLWIQKRDLTVIKWRINVRDIGDRNLQTALEDYWAKVYAIFQGIDNQLRITAQKDDTGLIVPSGLDRRKILSVPVNQLAAAEKLRDTQFDLTKLPMQRAEISLTGYINNILGAPEPLWRVRAGDVVMVDGLFPQFMKGGNENSVFDKLRSFYIRETEYNLSDDILTITPDWPTNRLDIYLASLRGME